MPKAPFFTILIPTRNRAEALRNALKSIRNQSFSNFEAFVVDNSDANQRAVVRRAVEEIGDSRFEYRKTAERLSMPDNWEFSSTFGSGEYRTILTDRCVYRRNALRIIHDVIASTDAKLVAWFLDTFGRDPGERLLDRLPVSGTVRRFRNRDVIDYFSRSSVGEWTRYLPRMLNSAVHRSVLDAIRASTGGRCFFPMTPDYTGGLLQLAHSESMVHIDLPLYVACGLGNGYSFRRGGALGTSYVADIGMPAERVFEAMPVKALLAHNLIMRDFTFVRHLCPERFAGLDYDRTRYYRELCSEVELLRSMRADWRPQRDEVLAALQHEREDVQRVVRGTREYRKAVMPAPAHGLLQAYRLARRGASRRNGDQIAVSPGDVFAALAQDRAKPRQEQPPQNAIPSETVIVPEASLVRCE